MRHRTILADISVSSHLLYVKSDTLVYEYKTMGNGLVFSFIDVLAQYHCIDIRGLIYDGKVSVTQQNVECQRWNSQHPHVHKYTDPSWFPDLTLADAANYCRALDGDDIPWCFTTSAQLRWDYCDMKTIFWGMQCNKCIVYHNDQCLTHIHTMNRHLIHSTNHLVWYAGKNIEICTWEDSICTFINHWWKNY